VDKECLIPVEVDGPPVFHRGQCTKCGRKSWRWYKWSHVELWFERHLCEPRKMTRTGLK